MAKRTVPPQIMAYLGPCRQPSNLVEEVIEQCGLGKMMGEAGLTDFDPLVVVMRLVTEEIEGFGRSLDKPKTRKAWCEIVSRIQDGDAGLDHNPFLPCRYCDQAFEPVVDERLLNLFLAWYAGEGTKELLAIHRCPSCGGTIEAKRTKKYEGDMHTPLPGSETSDIDWAYRLLSRGGWEGTY